MSNWHNPTADPNIEFIGRTNFSRGNCQPNSAEDHGPGRVVNNGFFWPFAEQPQIQNIGGGVGDQSFLRRFTDPQFWVGGVGDINGTQLKATASAWWVNFNPSLVNTAAEGPGTLTDQYTFTHLQANPYQPAGTL